MNDRAQRSSTTIEREYDATVEELWDMWTTQAGIEAWWGPGGFGVTVQSIDLRPGGVLNYTMHALESDKVAFMKAAGMPVSTRCSMTFIDVEPPRRLAYRHRVDFVPGVEHYDVTHVIEIEPVANGKVHLRLTIDVMHNGEWTQRAVAGWEDELGKLATALQKTRR